jgi:hypothetical protein
MKFNIKKTTEIMVFPFVILFELAKLHTTTCFKLLI